MAKKKIINFHKIELGSLIKGKTIYLDTVAVFMLLKNVKRFVI